MYFLRRQVDLHENTLHEKTLIHRTKSHFWTRVKIIKKI